MKFEKEKVSALSGRTEVRFTIEGQAEKEGAFRIVAHSAGIDFGTLEVTSQDELRALAQALGGAVSAAWREHLRLREAVINMLKGQ